MRDYIIWAERALLGAVLLDPAGQHEVLDLVELGDMFRPWHAQVLAAMQRVRGRGILPDPVQVYQELRSDPDLPASVSADAVPLAGLMEAVPRASHASAYGVMVVEGGIRQRLDLAASRLVHASETGALEAALRQAAQVRGELTACQARWLALPGHLRSELPAPSNQVRGDTGLGPCVEAVPEGLARPKGAAAEAAGARALRDLAAAPTQLAQVRGWLRPGHFPQAGHGELYAVIQDLDAAGKPVDAVTIAWEAARRGVAANPGGFAPELARLLWPAPGMCTDTACSPRQHRQGRTSRPTPLASPGPCLSCCSLPATGCVPWRPSPGQAAGLRATPAFLPGGQVRPSRQSAQPGREAV
jgi:DnaB helicase-like protein